LSSAILSKSMTLGLKIVSELRRPLLGGEREIPPKGVVPMIDLYFELGERKAVAVLARSNRAVSLCEQFPLGPKVRRVMDDRRAKRRAGA
jgi:hypothetical protein